MELLHILYLEHLLNNKDLKVVKVILQDIEFIIQYLVSSFIEVKGHLSIHWVWNQAACEVDLARGTLK